LLILSRPAVKWLFRALGDFEGTEASPPES
jgi:hypothetical protein